MGEFPLILPGLNWINWNSAILMPFFTSLEDGSKMCEVTYSLCGNTRMYTCVSCGIFTIGSTRTYTWERCSYQKTLPSTCCYSWEHGWIHAGTPESEYTMLHFNTRMIHECMHTHVRTIARMHACMHAHTHKGSNIFSYLFYVTSRTD